MVAKPLCPLYKNIIKPLDRARYPELRSYSDSRHSHINGLAIRAYITMVSDSIPFAVDTNLVSGT